MRPSATSSEADPFTVFIWMSGPSSVPRQTASKFRLLHTQLVTNASHQLVMTKLRLIKRPWSSPTYTFFCSSVLAIDYLIIREPAILPNRFQAFKCYVVLLSILVFLKGEGREDFLTCIPRQSASLSARSRFPTLCRKILGASKRPPTLVYSSEKTLGRRNTVPLISRRF